MDHMWSPWRSDHVSSWEERKDENDDRGLFERIGEDTENDEQNYVCWRGENVYVVMNLYPYNNGHVMIVPYRRVESYEYLTREEQMEMSSTLSRTLEWLRVVLQPEGFNVGMNIGKAAGAGIPRHLHMHIVPRWSGDTNFMPVTAETKVLPEALRKTYNRLTAHIRQTTVS